MLASIESGSTSITYSVPGSPPCRARVDEHKRVVAAQNLVCEVEPATAEVGDGDIRRKLTRAQTFRHLAREAVISEPEIAHGSDQDHALTSTSSDLKNRKRPLSRSISCIGSLSIVTPR